MHHTQIWLTNKRLTHKKVKMQRNKLSNSVAKIFSNSNAGTHHRLISTLSSLTLFAWTPSFSIAQELPTKPIQVIAPVGAGGATDVIVRSMLPKMSEFLKTSLVVENIPGAGGLVGTGAIARSPSDGSSIGIATSAALAANPHLQKKLPYDTAKNFSPICRIGTGPYILVVHPSLNIKTLPELLSLSKKEDLSFASPGVGSSAHIAQELFKFKTSSNYTHVPYKGTGQAINDTVGGHTQVLFEAPGPLMAHIKAGKLIPLGVSSPTRLKSMPDIPTFGELGYKDIVLEGWIGLIARAGTPLPILEKFSQACESALKQPDVMEQAQSLGFEVNFANASEFDTFITRENKHWGEVIKISGIKPE